jgi:hypothetical protein
VSLSGSSYNPAAVADVDSGGPDLDAEPCVNSGPLCDPSLQQTPEPDKCPTGATYTITFPVAGNFKFVCLVHRDMTGTLHVLPPATPLPFQQADYDLQAADHTHDLIGDAGNDKAQNGPAPDAGSVNHVITSGEVIATGGGKAYLAVMRFLPSSIVRGSRRRHRRVDERRSH